jgi:hypothetical protein
MKKRRVLSAAFQQNRFQQIQPNRTAGLLFGFLFGIVGRASLAHAYHLRQFVLPYIILTPKNVFCRIALKIFS